MRTIAATAALHQLETVAYVDGLGYARCVDCAPLINPGEPATPAAFSIDDRCETCSVVLRSIRCGHWRSTTVSVEPHPTLPDSDRITKRCEICGDESVLTGGTRANRSARFGRGYYGDRNDLGR